ncbi:unnamed protein product, partial [Cylicostephanus goldi]
LCASSCLYLQTVTDGKALQLIEGRSEFFHEAVLENPALFSQSFWYLGICDVDVAYRYLTSDRSAQRPGLFVIFSPLCLNPDPNDYRPFLLMFLCKKTGKTKEILKAERAGKLLLVTDVTKFLITLTPLQMLTITRSLLGHYELFGNRYHTLYDLVYHLSQTDSELPHRLIYETLSTVSLRTFERCAMGCSTIRSGRFVYDGCVLI